MDICNFNNEEYERVAMFLNEYSTAPKLPFNEGKKKELGREFADCIYLLRQG